MEHGGSMEGMGSGSHMMHMGNLKRKFIVSLLMTIPIVLMSPMMGVKLPFQIEFAGSDWVVLIIATVLFFYGGMPFLSGARMELKERKPAMMTLIALGITVAYVYSLYAFISNHTGGEHKMDFFWELATLIVIMLLGHWIEMKAVSGAGDALQKMAELLPGTAALVGGDGSVKDVPLKDIKTGQKVLVKAGGKVPADGIVAEGETTVNESMVTGEAREIKKAEGDKVIGGSVNGAGTITVEVTGTGETGFLAQVMKLVEAPGTIGQKRKRCPTRSRGGCFM
jgi:Cu2+-exporting ATPase